MFSPSSGEILRLHGVPAQNDIPQLQCDETLLPEIIALSGTDCQMLDGLESRYYTRPVVR